VVVVGVAVVKGEEEENGRGGRKIEEEVWEREEEIHV
jgi:hypothetical protein